MSFGYTNRAKKLKVGNPVAKAILLLLADMASDSGFCFPSERTIAETLELGESTVRKHLQNLDSKFLTKRKMSGDKWKHNGYQLIFAPDFGEQKAEESPLPDVADTVSPLPQSGDDEISPLPESNVTATTYHRYDVATKHKKKDLLLEPSREPEEKESVSSMNSTNAKNKKTAPALDKSFLASEFFKIFGEFYPNVALSPKKIKLINSRIRDGTIFRKALQYWDDNDYRAESIGKICEKYDELILEQNGASNGTSLQKSNGNGFRESAAERRERESIERQEFRRRKREFDQNGTVAGTDAPKLLDRNG